MCNMSRVSCIYMHLYCYRCDFEEAQTNWQQTQNDLVSKLSKNEEQLKLFKKKKDKVYK